MSEEAFSPRPEKHTHVDPTGRPRLVEAMRKHSRSFHRPTHLAEMAEVIRRSFTASTSSTVLNEPQMAEARRAALQAARQELKVFAEMPKEEVLKLLKVDPHYGLSTREAEARLALHGPNELPKDPPTPLWKLFAEQFQDLLVLMLIAASIISAALGEYPASITIIAILLANALLGVIQESRAGAALEALQSLSSPTAKVKRDGRLVDIESAKLVPGDIVYLDVGNKVPADIRLIEAVNVTCVEMALTGESEGVRKYADWRKPAEEESPSATPATGAITATEGGIAIALSAAGADAKEASGNGQGNGQQGQQRKKKKEQHLTDPTMVYMGCEVQDGHGMGVVLKTGLGTKMGEIARLLSTAEREDTPLQQKLDGLGQRLGIASLAISIVVFIVGVATDRGTDPTDSNPTWLQMLLVAVSLTVAAVPEGLPACVTITLAIGMQNMAKKHALVRNLHSVETLGSASVICTDKTGTLTAGVMTAVRMMFAGSIYAITGQGYDPNGYVVPEGTDLSNPEAVQTAAQQLQGGHHGLPILIAVLCSNATLQFDHDKGKWVCHGNNTERPLVVLGRKVGYVAEELRTYFPREAENPFNSTRKMMSTLHKINPGAEKYTPFFTGLPYVACVKGAPNFVLQECVGLVDTVESDDGTPSLGISVMTDEIRARITGIIDDFSEKAYRVLAVAYQPFDRKPTSVDGATLEKNLIFAGLVASIDPPRPEVPGSIEKAHNAGIRVIMITGDYVKTAKAIATIIGLLKENAPENKAVDCEVIREYGTPLEEIRHELRDMKAARQRRLEEAKEALEAERAQLEQQHKDGRLSAEAKARLDEINRLLANPKLILPEDQGERKKKLLAKKKELEEKIDAITRVADVYARAKPADKITIVRSLQRQGCICSMTGDGVNDAPALKQANIGVAMGITGTDVAKASSDMVLTDDNFCSIVEAIQEGRTMYMNISKFVFYLLSTNTAEVLTILICVLMGLQSPMLPIQILWLNLTTDGMPAIALAVENTEPGIMEEGPRDPKESIIEKVMLTGIVIQTIVLTSCVIGVYLIGLQFHTDTWDGNPALCQPCAPMEVPCLNPAQCTFIEHSNQEDARNLGVAKARTMAVLYIVFAELLRAYTSRALRVSIFEMGPFTNRFMQWAVGGAVVATLVIHFTPGVRDIFSMELLDGRSWAVILGMALVPVTVDELCKLVYRITGFGVRPKVRDLRQGVTAAYREGQEEEEDR